MNLTQLKTVETKLKCKRYSQNKVQGLFCEETGLPWVYLQETRGQNIIMHINRRSIAQKDKIGPLVGKTKKSRGLNRRNRGLVVKFLYGARALL
jgi:hypothetical protein